MTTYKIISSAGQNLGTYEANSREAALDAMARDAGYADQAEAESVAGAFEGSVETVEVVQYQLDADMLGPEFKGTTADLRDFIPILAGQTGRPVTDFVARQHVAQQPGAVEPSEHDWNTALEWFVEKRPDLF